MKKSIIPGIQKRSRWLWPAGALFLFVVLAVVVWNRTLATKIDDPLNAADRAWIKAHPVIRLAPDPDFPPVEFFAGNGDYRGITAEYVSLLEKRLGIRIEIVRLRDWNEVIDKAKSRQIDVYVATETPQRADYMLFTRPFLEFPVVIIARRKLMGPLSLEKLDGMKVSVVSEYAAHNFIAYKYPKLNLDPVPDVRTGLRNVSFGLSDAFVENLATATYYIEKEGLTNLRIAGDSGFVYRMGFCSRKDWPELNRILEKGLATLSVAEKQAMYKKWIPVEPRSIFTSREFRTGLLAAVTVIFLMAAGVIVWNRALARQVRVRTGELENELAERRLVEQALRESEEKFRVLAETIPAAVIVHQGEEMVYLNPMAIRATGYEERECLHLKFWDMAHDDFRELVKERGLARQRGEDVPSRYEYKWVTKGGEVRWALLSGARIEYQGKPAGIATLIDITERKQMEEELQRARDDLEKRVTERTTELRRAKELLEEEISVRNRTERVITARLRLLEFAVTHTVDELLEATLDEAEALTDSLIGFYHFLGADQKTLSLQNWSSRTKAEFCKAKPKGHLHDLSAAGVWVDCIHEHRPVIHNDYASLPHRRGLPPDHASLIRELVVPVFRGDTIVAIIAVGNKPTDYTSQDVEVVSLLADLAWDITERKQAGELLRKSELAQRKLACALAQKNNFLRTLIDAIPDLIFYKDCNRAYLGCNKAFEALAGRPEEDLVGRTDLAIFSRDVADAFREMDLAILSTEESRRNEEWIDYPDGRRVLLETLKTPFFDLDGEILGVVGVSRDITERKRMEEALKESESRVRRKLESILDPEGDTGELELADILDAPQIQALMDDLYRVTGLKMSIIDLKGRVLADVGWQEICSRFHRNHPETLKRCIESDSDLTIGVQEGEFRTHRCKNNMWHLVTPIIVGGRHMGNLFMGQFFFADEQIDYDLFRSQARRYGFPEEEYMAALEAVPRHSEELVSLGKAVFLRLTDMFSKQSYANIKLAHFLAERDRLTQTLRDANLVVENSPAVLFRWKGDDEWQVELVSGNVTQFGYTPDDFLSGAVIYSAIMHPDDLERVTREVHDFCDEGADQFRLEYRIMTGNGGVRWVNEHTHVERDAAGGIRNFEGIVIDVTERKLAEDSIRESQAKYQAIVDSFDGLIYVCSQDLRIEFLNRKLIERTGRDAVGELCYKVIHERDTICPWCMNERVFAGETLHWDMFSPKDENWYEVLNVPIRHADGSMSKHSMMIDITDRKRFEEELQRQKQLLQELNETLEKRITEEVAKNREKDIMLIQQNRQAALGEMLDHIAHQWKQPLTSLSLVIHDLGDAVSAGELTDEHVRETVCISAALLDHMTQTMEVFRGFYRPDKEKKVFGIKDAIDQALAFIAPALSFNSIAVELDVDPGLTAFGYSKEYVQVLLNILANARDVFRARGTEHPRVMIRAFAEESTSVVTVTDNGGGIPDTIKDRIFDFYFTTNEAGGGTGIGLYMARNIIEKNMGGTLGAENTEDGARFRIAVSLT
jgi:PAS domain S-box-containing protein